MHPEIVGRASWNTQLSRPSLEEKTEVPRTKHCIVLTVIANPTPNGLYVTAPGTLPIFVPAPLDIKKGD